MLTSKQQSYDNSSLPRYGKPLSSIASLFPLYILLPRLVNVGNSYYEYNFLLPMRRMSKPIAQIIHNQVLIIDIRQVLIDDFNHRKNTALTFPSKLSDFTTHAAIKQFQYYFAEVISNMKYFCTSCGLFISIVEVTWLQRKDLIFQNGIQSNIFLKEGYDIYGQNGDYFYFCQSCIKEVQKSKIPQFRHINNINTYICHSYSQVFQDLILVEELVIAYAHLIIFMIKLRFSDASISSFYSRIRSYVIVLPQQPGPLFNLSLLNNI